MTDSTLISRAAEFAARAHAGQTRRGSDAPYFTHVEAVARRVQELCDCGQADPAMVAAAYLHDTMEDCAAIQRRLQAAPPAAWDSLHAQLSAAIIKEYEARFETPNN